MYLVDNYIFDTIVDKYIRQEEKKAIYLLTKFNFL